MYLQALINGVSTRITDLHIDNAEVYLTYIVSSASDTNTPTKTIKKQIEYSSTILATNVSIDSKSRLEYNVQGLLNGNSINVIKFSVIKFSVIDLDVYYVYIDSTSRLRAVKKTIQNYETTLLLNSIFSSTGILQGADNNISGTVNYLTKFTSAGDNIENSIIEQEGTSAISLSADTKIKIGSNGEIYFDTAAGLLKITENNLGIEIGKSGSCPVCYLGATITSIISGKYLGFGDNYINLDASIDYKTGLGVSEPSTNTLWFSSDDGITLNPSGILELIGGLGTYCPNLRITTVNDRTTEVGSLIGDYSNSGIDLTSNYDIWIVSENGSIKFSNLVGGSYTEIVNDGTIKIAAGKDLDCNTNGAYFKPRRISTSAIPTPDTNELLVWRDPDDNKTYLVYNDTDEGVRSVEMT